MTGRLVFSEEFEEMKNKSEIKALVMPPALAMVAVFAIILLGFGCSKQRSAGSQEAKGNQDSAEAGIIAIDGSSTVYPISEAVAEEFQKEKKVKVTIGVSGTGGGFKKFCTGEIDLADASRPVKQKEIDKCKEHKIDFIELPVAFDGIAVVVNPEATWVDKLSVEELKKLWSPAAQKTITKWSQLREGWPDQELHLFGPGVDSGTYDYFTAAVVGEEHSSRGDFTSSEDDNVLVQGVSGDKYALGFFGFAYYVENKDKLRLVPIDDGDESNGAGAILPSLESVAGGSYQPLSRPIFIYVSSKGLERPEVKDFVHFYLEQGAKLSKEVGYIPLPAKAYTLAAQRFDGKKLGSVFAGGSKVGVTIEALLASE